MKHWPIDLEPQWHNSCSRCAFTSVVCSQAWLSSSPSAVSFPPWMFSIMRVPTTVLIILCATLLQSSIHDTRKSKIAWWDSRDRNVYVTWTNASSLLWVRSNSIFITPRDWENLHKCLWHRRNNLKASQQIRKLKRHEPREKTLAYFFTFISSQAKIRLEAACFKCSAPILGQTNNHMQLESIHPIEDKLDRIII